MLVLVLALAAGAGKVHGGDPRPDPVFFKHPDAYTAQLIVDALGYLNKQAISDHTRGRERLEEIGYWSVSPLITMLLDGSFSERRNAALALGAIGDHRAIPPLLKAAENDPNLYVPSFAALMVGLFGREGDILRLEGLVKNRKKDPRRISSVLSITKIHSERSYEILERVVLSRDLSLLQEAATFCLGFYRQQALVRDKQGRAEPCPALMKALKSSRIEHRRSALLAVALLGHRDLKELYLQYADPRRDQDVQCVALLALGRFRDEDVTRLYLSRLSNQKTPERVKLMAALMMKDRKDPWIRDELRRLIPQDKKVKAALTLALSNFEDLETVKIIIRRLVDSNKQVRAAAAIALSRLTDPALKAMAIKALTDALMGKAGAINDDVRFNMERARRILKTGQAGGEFLWLGNREFADALPKDVEERVLDFVNHEVERVLGILSLQPEKSLLRPDGRREVNDQASDLRDLKAFLERYPYFESFDIPEPMIAITPRPEPVKQEGK